MFIFNPYSGENFIGRDREIDFIIEQVRLGQNIVLTAPRRFGKTSLAWEIISRLKLANFYTAYIDIFPVTSVNHLSAEIVEAVLENHELGEEFRLLEKFSGTKIQSQEILKEAEVL
jgi:AAA+ ATPase superfamily predicted ATPase